MDTHQSIGVKSNKQLISLFITLLIGGAVLAYVVYKASVNGFTHDESYTYLLYTQQSFMDLISYKGWYTNNHILNSIGMKYMALLFGPSEFALRLPNLMAMALYMVFIYLMFKNSKPLVAVPVFVLLCTNLLITDLFGLARGYGLSFGFMVMSLYFLITYFKDRKNWSIVLFHLGALLAIFSNFTMLTYYASAMAVYGLFALTYQRVVSGEKFKLLPLIKPHIAPLIVVIIVLYEPVRRLLTYTDLHYGGSNGFYPDTVHQVIYNMIHSTAIPDSAMYFLKALLTAQVLISLLIIGREIIKKNKVFLQEHQGLIISGPLLFIISILIILSNKLAGADYPVSRFSAFLIVLVVINAGFLAQYLSAKHGRLIYTILGCMAIISAASFTQKTDLYSSAEWVYDMHTKNMLSEIEKHYKTSNRKEKVSVGINWVFEPTINFYRETNELNWLEPATREGLQGDYDYYYINKDSISALNTTYLQVIAAYEQSKTVLLANNKR